MATAAIFYSKGIFKGLDIIALSTAEIEWKELFFLLDPKPPLCPSNSPTDSYTHPSEPLLLLASFLPSLNISEVPFVIQTWAPSFLRN